jgi:hypothetical protein
MQKAGKSRPRRAPRFERLTAWQAVHALTLALYRETVRWPEQHQDVLAHELRTSATAAEVHLMLGSAAPDAAGFRRQLDAGLGKLARVGSAWAVVQDLGMVKPECWGEIEAMRDHAERLTRGLYVALGRRPGRPAEAARRRRPGRS